MLILNEKKYAEDLYLGRNNEVKSVIAKVGYITRYQLYVLGYSDDDNYSYAVKWMKGHHDNFDESCYSKLISDAVKKAHQRLFFNIDNIIITKSELEVISSLNNLRAEKFLFVLLCMAKQQRVIYGFTNGLVKYSLPDLCKMARVSVPTDEREYILYELVQSGCLSYPKKNDTCCLIVNFIDDDGEAGLIANEIDCKELAYTYLNWKNGSGYDRCENCGRLFRKNRKRKYCHECSKYKSVGDRIDYCIDCGKEIVINAMASKTCRCTECQKIADHPPMETKIVTCIDCKKEFEMDSSSRVIRCEECLIKNNRRKRMKNYYKNKSDYIFWVDDKCFLLKRPIDEIENSGYEFESWDMMQEPLVNYDVIINFVHKENKNIGCIVLAKRIFDLDAVPPM